MPARVVAPRPAGAAPTPFGPRLHATAVYLKTFQALSHQRLQKALSDLAIQACIDTANPKPFIWATSADAILARAVRACLGSHDPL